MASKKYVVTVYGGETYEVTADKVEVDPHNSNRVTLYVGDDVVCQENNAQSVRPKNG